jgi:integrase
MSSRLLPFLHRRGSICYFFWTDEQGRRREESLRTTDVTVAKERYQQRMVEIENGASPTSSAAQSLADACSEWLRDRQFRVSKGSFLSERSIVRNLLGAFGSNSRLRTLADANKLHEYQQNRLRVAASAKTVNNELQVLRGILERAHLWHRVERDYKRLRTKKSDVPQALTEEESIRFLSAVVQSCPSAVARYAAALSYGTGMRSGEIKPLRLGDLHERDAFPHLIVGFGRLVGQWPQKRYSFQAG